MKKFITTVLIGFIASISYLAAMLLVSTPMLVFTKLGVVGSRLSVLVPRLQNGINTMQGINSVLFAVQVVLIFIACILFFMFMLKVINVFLPEKEESYFRFLYTIAFFFMIFVPEILLVLSVFINMPVYIIVGSVAGFSSLVMGMAIFVSKNILTDDDLPDFDLDLEEENE